MAILWAYAYATNVYVTSVEGCLAIYSYPVRVHRIHGSCNTGIGSKDNWLAVLFSSKE
jgi:hypothetical protein